MKQTYALLAVAVMCGVAIGMSLATLLFLANEKPRGDVTPQQLAQIEENNPVIGPLLARVYSLFGVPDPTDAELEFLIGLATDGDCDWPEGATDAMKISVRRNAIVALAGFVEAVPNPRITDHCLDVLESLRDDPHEDIAHEVNFVLTLEPMPLHGQPTPAKK